MKLARKEIFSCFRFELPICRPILDSTCHAITCNNEGHVDWSAGAIVKKKPNMADNMADNMATAVYPSEG